MGDLLSPAFTDPIKRRRSSELKRRKNVVGREPRMQGLSWPIDAQCQAAISITILDLSNLDFFRSREHLQFPPFSSELSAPTHILLPIQLEWSYKLHYISFDVFIISHYITMQRAFSSRARSSVLNSSSKLRSTSFNLQQQRFAHKVRFLYYIRLFYQQF